MCPQKFRFLAVDELIFRASWRVWMIAAIAALAVCAPTIVLIAAPVLSAIAFFSSQPTRFRLDLPSISVIALTIFSAFSMLWTVDLPLAFRATAIYAILGVMLITARFLLRTSADLHTVALGYLAGCLVLIARVVILALTRGSGQGKFRLNLPDVNANYAGYAFALGFAMVLFLWVGLPKSKLIALLLLMIAALLAFGILVTDTRASFLGLLALLLWLAASRLLKRPPLKYLVAAVVIFAAAIATGIFDKLSLLVEGLLGRPTGDWSGRLELWPLAREWWVRHFLVGSGASTFQASNIYGVGAHNLVLEIGTGLGIVGVAIYATFLGSSLSTGDSTRGALLVGSIIAVSAFSYLTGQWDASPAAWIGLAVFSRTQALELAEQNRPAAQRAVP